MKTKIEELEPGDLVYYKLWSSYEVGKYLGKGLVKNFTLGTHSLEDMRWIYYRRSFGKFIKDLFKKL